MKDFCAPYHQVVGCAGVRSDEIMRAAGDQQIAGDLSLICGGDRKVAQVIESADDITQRRPAEAALPSSEQGLRLFFESAPIALAMLDKRMRYVRASRRWMNDFRLGDRDLTGLSHYDVFPEVPAHWIEAHRRGLKGETLCGEDRFERAEGPAQWVRWQISPWTDHAGDLGGIVIFSEDITERKKTEQALEDRDRQFRDLADSIPQLVWMADPHGWIFWYNQRWYAYTGTTPAEMEGWGWQSVHDPAKLPEVLENWLRSIRTGEPFEMVYPLKGRDGTFRQFLTRVTPVKDGEGNVVRWFGTNTDVDEQKKIEDALRLSEQRFKIAFQSSVVGFVIAREADGTIIDINAKWQSMLGYSHEEVLGRSLVDLGIATTSDYQAAMQDLRRNGVIQDREMTLRTKQGQERVFLVYAQRILISGEPHLIANLVDVTNRQLAEDALRKSEEQLRSIVNNAPYAIYRTLVEKGGRFIFANPAMVRMLGYNSVGDLMALNLERDVYSDPDDRKLVIEQMRKKGSYSDLELRWRKKNGEELRLSSSGRMLLDDGTEIFESIAENITERHALERQLHQAQKMEAIGRLAGGVAHDFNNILGIITGYCELGMERIPADGDIAGYLTQIKAAATRATSLTRQLLAFSRQQVVFPKLVDLNSVVTNVLKIIGRTIGEDIRLSFNAQPGLGSVRADVGQIEQILMNLVINSRDAMPRGGQITIESRNLEVDNSYSRGHEPIAPGSYVTLSVSDTGIGMDEATKAKIFDPFFTTKEPGKGTGLGLATVYGIVKQSGGYIYVYSEPGKGTAFKIHFPRVNVAAEPIQEPSQAEGVAGGETILIVEDDPNLRHIGVESLKSEGYKVLEAHDSEEAIEIVKNNTGRIQLLLTDVVMPGTNGVELFGILKELCTGLRAVFMSGYAGDSIRTQLASIPDLVLLEKPFSRSSLLSALRRALQTAPP